MMQKATLSTQPAVNGSIRLNQQKKKHTLASMTPDNNRAPIVSNIVPTTNNITARAIALVGNFGGGFSN